MGAWGHASFENDDALDWVGELVDSDDATPLVDAFSAVVGTTDYLEAYECSVALAAAEVIATAHGHPPDNLPPEVSAYLDRLGKGIPDGLLDQARAALERVRNESELRELWEESGEFANWIAHLDALKGRLE